MIQVFSQFPSKAAIAWCKAMHPDPMWPVKGQYICPKCQRKYPVPWEERHPRSGAEEQSNKVVNIAVAQERAA